MRRQESLDKMKDRQNYRNLWHTDLVIYHVVVNVEKADARSFVSVPKFSSVLTQHKVEMDKRDGKFGPPPVMSVPPPQHMSRIDQPIPPAVGYPPQQPYGYPPPQGYPPAPPPNYPPAGYPPR